jgi:hypothetical protein
MRWVLAGVELDAGRARDRGHLVEIAVEDVEIDHQPGGGDRETGPFGLGNDGSACGGGNGRHLVFS